MDDSSFADLLADLDAELADPRSRAQAASDVLARVKRWHPSAVYQCAAGLQLEALGVGRPASAT